MTEIGIKYSTQTPLDDKDPEMFALNKVKHSMRTDQLETLKRMIEFMDRYKYFPVNTPNRRKDAITPIQMKALNQKNKGSEGNSEGAKDAAKIDGAADGSNSTSAKRPYESGEPPEVSAPESSRTAAKRPRMQRKEVPLGRLATFNARVKAQDEAFLKPHLDAWRALDKAAADDVGNQENIPPAAAADDEGRMSDEALEGLMHWSPVMKNDLEAGDDIC